jgi:hypothetical protein
VVTISTSSTCEEERFMASLFFDIMSIIITNGEPDAKISPKGMGRQYEVQRIVSSQEQ